MKDLVTVYLLSIRIIIFIYPCSNRFAPQKLKTTTFFAFGVYIARYRVLGCSIWGSTYCYTVCTTEKVSGFSLLHCLIKFLVSSHQNQCLRLICDELQHHHFEESTNSNFLYVHTTSMCDV